MEELQSAEETTFVVDEVSNIVKEAVEGTIGGSAYQQNKVNQWTSNVVEQCLNQLTKLGKPFKYIVTCVIMQKNGAGLHTASSCYWDNQTDGSCTVRWENKTIGVIALLNVLDGFVFLQGHVKCADNFPETYNFVILEYHHPIPLFQYLQYLLYMSAKYRMMV